MLQLHLLDAPRLVAGERTLPLPLRDAALLAWLLREGPTPRATLAALLWPGLDAASAGNHLRQQLHRLRRGLDAPAVVDLPGGRLALAPGVEHDLATPSEWLRSRPDPWAVGSALLGDETPQGLPALADWLAVQRAWWRQRLHAALLASARRARQAGASARALVYAQRAAALAPADAPTRRLLHELAGTEDPSAAPLAAVVDRLHRDGLQPDAVQLMDALWLSTVLPAPPPATAMAGAPGHDDAAPAAGGPPPPAGTGADARGRADAPAAAPAAARAATEPAADGGGLYPRVTPSADPAADRGPRHARSVRVAGATALREPAALARALLPLAKRRPSTRRLVLDEVATAERYADTGVLVPVMVGVHERGFDATLLVEDGPAMPLWRTLAAELETLLARQGGFRRFRRYTLAVPPGAPPVLRLRGGATLAPRRLAPDGGASLVIVATDGTGPAWADGRHAAMLAALGRQHSLALLQWMPERLWPHTALGAAEGGLRAPRAGAPNAALQLARPSWLGDDEAVLAVPLVSLRPAAFARLARLLAAKPGAVAAAALLFPAAANATPAPDAPPPAAAAAPGPDAATRIARFRSVATPRLMQVAVQLSAAAPLTLPVVRLVHRVMQPDAPAEDLPLLLLGGLLERRTEPGGDTTAARDDNDVVFEFAPGVRDALQAALLKSEADAVRQAVARHIAERSGGVHDFRALLLDPTGDVPLPDWAQPFADVSRQVQALFPAPPRVAPPVPPAAVRAPAAPPPPEAAAAPVWAPGVSMQAEPRLPDAVQALAWSRDGTRLAVLHAHGLRLLRTVDAPAGPRGFERLPQALRATAHMLVVKGSGLSDGVMEAALAALRDGLHAEFRGGWRFTYHTVEPAFTRPDGRAPATDVRRALQLALKPEALVVFVGDDDFLRSPWMREAETQARQLFAARRGALWRLTCTQPATNPATLTSWRIQSADDRTNILVPLLEASAGGWTLASAIGDAGALAVPEVAFDAQACSLAWDAGGELLVADDGRRRVLRERDLRPVDDFPDALTHGARPLLLAHPRGPALALSASDGLHLHAAGSPRWARLDDGLGGLDAAWSPDGTTIAIRDGRGSARTCAVDTAAWTTLEPTARYTAGPAWDRDGRAWYGSSGGEVVCWNGSTLDTTLARAGTVRAIACSPVDGLIAAAWDDGHIAIGAPGRGWSAPMPVLDPLLLDGPIQLAFAPPTSDEGTGYEALAVARGDGLWLLRIDAQALALSPPASTEAPADAEPSAGEVVDAALAVLQALAMVFHVGAFAPDATGFTRDRYAKRLGIEAGTPADATLVHLVRSSEYMFSGPVRRVLDGAPDPLAQPDAELGLQALERGFETLRDALPRLGFGMSMDALPANDAERHYALLKVQQWLARMTRLLRLAAPEARRAADAAYGTDLAAFFASLAPLADPGVLAGGGTVLASRVPLLNALASAMVRLQSDAVRQALAPAAAQAELLHPEEGDSAFLGAAHMADYAERLVGALAEAAGSLLQASDAPAAVTVGYPIEEDRFATVAELAEAAGCRPGTPTQRFGGNEVAGWPVAADRVVPLLRLVGGIVVTALALRTGRPLPADWGAPGPRLLWVDDRPENNLRERERLAQRGVRVETVRDTGAALARLAARPAVAAVVSDWSRPPDAAAGATLLDALRARGGSQPVVIYAGRQADAVREEAVRRGARGATNRFDELEALLRDALLAPPPA